MDTAKYYTYSELPGGQAPRKKSTASKTSRVLGLLLLMFTAAFVMKQGFKRCYHSGPKLGGLPTHFKLNSGDKIPSVALGRLIQV